MKAIICAKYGLPDVFELKEVEKPVPNENEILIKIHTASINAYDWRLMKAEPFMVRFMGGGVLKPKKQIPGVDISGRIEAAGRNIKQFKPGDDVFGSLTRCPSGGFAEYACAPENAFVLKPAGMTFEQAASIPMAALTALQGLRDYGEIKQGQKVLINGASGGVGTFAVQIAKSFGAEVTAVTSTGKIDMVRSLGADYAIDYTKEDFTKGEKLYDLVFAANGFHPVSDYIRVLNPDGIYVVAGGTMAQMFQAMLLGPMLTRKGNKKVVSYTEHPNQKDMLLIAKLFEEGKVIPVIDRCYPLNQVPTAMQYVYDGHAKGKVVINI